MGQIEPEHPELFAFEIGKIAESDCVYTQLFTNIDQFVYTLSSTNIDQSAPNLVNVCAHIIPDEINYGSYQTKTELSALELENLPYLPLFYTITSANID